jgi:flagellar biosynthesis protein FliQ
LPTIRRPIRRARREGPRRATREVLHVSAGGVSIGAWVAFLELAGPALLAMLVIGLGAGILQTATQIREASIPFVLKLAGVAVLTSAAGRLMMGGIEAYAARLFLAIPGLLHG